MKKLIKRTSYCFLAMFLVFVACTKEEFMPPPIGEQLPDGEPNETYLEKLKDSPYTLFLAAWERSTMEDVFTARGEKAPFTLLVPTNEAFENAGLDIQSIQAMEIEDLNDLLSYHFLTDRWISSNLESSSGSKFSNTLLKHPTLDLFVGFTQYTYKHFIDFKNHQLFLNGKSMGNMEPEMVKNGNLWPIDKLLRKPEKFMLDVLNEDGRFSIFLEVCRLNDATYRTRFGNTSQFNPILDMMVAINQTQNRRVIYPFSLLAPTDEAFKKAGFNTAEDFTAINARTSETTFNRRIVIASDSILVNHLFGAKTYAVSQNIADAHNPLLFYSNDMNNDWLGGYQVFYERPGSGGAILPAVVMPLDFIQEDESQLRIRVKGSSHEPGTVLESDINTLNGPIHVIDRLLIPEGFKLTP